jgi:hypothetical protein
MRNKYSHLRVSPSVEQQYWSSCLVLSGVQFVLVLQRGACPGSMEKGFLTLNWGGRMLSKARDRGDMRVLDSGSCVSS